MGIRIVCGSSVVVRRNLDYWGRQGVVSAHYGSTQVVVVDFCLAIELEDVAAE